MSRSDDKDPARAPTQRTRHDMNAEARKTLNELRSLSNIERYLKTAKAELASSPCDERLRAFIDLIEGLLQDERNKLSTTPALTTLTGARS